MGRCAGSEAAEETNARNTEETRERNEGRQYREKERERESVAWIDPFGADLPSSYFFVFSRVGGFLQRVRGFSFLCGPVENIAGALSLSSLH